jgi:hypothetical protein
MRKWLITLIILVVLIALGTKTTNAILECERVMTPEQTQNGCSIIGSWEYPRTCDNYIIYVYNSSPTNILNLSMSNYSIIGLCNATFNITTIGSYFLNFTSGDQAIITVEVDDTLNLAITIGLSVFAALFIIIGMILWFSRGTPSD